MDDSVLSRTALPVLLTSSLLRAIISLDPSLDIHLDCVFFHTQLLHITSVAVWISLSITCFALLWRIVTSTTRRGRFAAVLSRAAQSSLLLFSLLRVVKIFFPRPISSLDAGLDNNTQLLRWRFCVYVDFVDHNLLCALLAVANSSLQSSKVRVGHRDDSRSSLRSMGHRCHLPAVGV